MKQELNTILAALRYYQQQGMGEPANRTDDIHDIATDGDEISLDAAAIDKLCEQLNCGVGLFCYVRVYLRPPGHPSGSPQPAFTHTFVQADTDETAYDLGNKEPFDAALIADGYAPANDYAFAVGPMLQPAHCDAAALVVVRGGIAEAVDGSSGNLHIIDLDNIEAGDPPYQLERGEGFEELLEDTDLEEGVHFVWDDTPWPKSDWQYEVNNGDTKLGYIEWLQHKKEAA